jgi:hypothetical protein
MQLGKEVATGFVSDEVQAAPDTQAGLTPGTPDAKAPAGLATRDLATTGPATTGPETAAAG